MCILDSVVPTRHSDRCGWQRRGAGPRLSGAPEGWLVGSGGGESEAKCNMHKAKWRQKGGCHLHICAFWSVDLIEFSGKRCNNAVLWEARAGKSKNRSGEVVCGLLFHAAVMLQCSKLGRAQGVCLSNPIYYIIFIIIIAWKPLFSIDGGGNRHLGKLHTSTFGFHPRLERLDP